MAPFGHNFALGGSSPMATIGSQLGDYDPLSDPQKLWQTLKKFVNLKIVSSFQFMSLWIVTSFEATTVTLFS